jgi:hypothetical protein
MQNSLPLYQVAHPRMLRVSLRYPQKSLLISELNMNVR